MKYEHENNDEVNIYKAVGAYFLGMLIMGSPWIILLFLGIGINALLRKIF
ncbi:MAG: hypothetical protein AABY22_09610 [Nanoarchaeota archaeon]